MKLEFADGRILDIIDGKELVKQLDTLGPKNDFAVLGDEYFIQAAYSDGGTFLFQYKDVSGMYESEASDADLDMVKDIFTAYLKGTGTWKTLRVWERMEAGGSTAPLGNPTISEPVDPALDLKDELLKSAKRSVTNWIKRKLK